jgi:hypothetical protein
MGARKETLKWVDRSSRSQGDAPDKEPDTWHLETTAGRNVLSIHRHIWEPGRWFLSQDSGQWRAKRLLSLDLEEAKREGVAIVLQAAEELAAMLKKAPK